MKQTIEKLAADAAEKLSKQMRRSVAPAGKFFDKQELINLIEASLEGWWTEGRWTQEFEQSLAKYLNIKNVLSCNSGSSANLLAFSALCSPSLGDRRLKPGSEVVTVAAGFPTTVNAIIQNGCVPVFVDIDIGTYNIDINALKKAISKKTAAIMIAHTLGNPYQVNEVKKICKKHNLWLVEDNCDGLGSKYSGKLTGTFGDVATLSFYPAHHITTAEGGAVLTDNPKLAKIIRSIRDWGRHCWCPTGHDNTCQNRFNWQLGALPKGYDHKYIYGELGYNLKLSDLHAAIGVAQIKKLRGFVRKRISNFNYLTKKLKSLEKYFILPKATENSEPSWFGYILTIKDDRIDRAKLLKFCQEKGVGTRLLFAGNITKQPYFIDGKFKYKIVGNLNNTDLVMAKSFWVGVWPGLNKSELDRIVNCLQEFISNEGI
ncbi:MAG: UDP-4-amino-4-deoxy-L-arabinose--oxoglutarate aminotransferase [candidate division WS2 bacterium ADurb.Bin280]|uniref:UDP-4-amino-4-deoxy-L-arabinose--oxoglutarate aminotransferase n=1 Tax=candidate division WS2 bacterium ADurb.Bin280 TaxID=1852829 RepID=A0A1V5SFK7_9BACT|nr:MAG: UDP-4-amino-4-deoxy-L-arabinose--oxoglutarate aminotransferase [candidate division WS2 bacterium ADurb.Bin280]